MDTHNAINEFLTTRRAKLTPTEVGLPDFGGRRRVPGLRREEVAMVAGMSAEYYKRLERGTATGVSEAVIEGVSRALQLDEAEHAHLHDLIRTANAGTHPRRTTTPSQLTQGLQQTIDAMSTVPVFVQNGRLDAVATNPLGRALFAPMLDNARPPVNAARFIFLDPRAQTFTPGAIKTPHLAATAIDGMTITGSLVQSSPTASRGIKSDTAGIRAYSSTGAATFVLDAATGSLTAEGTFRTGATGSRVELADGGGTAYARFYSGGPLDAGMGPAYIIGSNNGAAAGARTSNLSLVSGRRNDGTGRWTGLALGADQVAIVAMNGASTVGAIVLYNDGTVSLGTGGRAIKGFDYATHTLATESDGYITLAHGLGITPAMAMAQLQGTLAYACVVTARSSSSFTIRVLTREGAPVSSGLSVAINWIVAA